MKIPFSRGFTLKAFLKHPVFRIAGINGAVALAAFLKDLLVASYMGTSGYADALTIAYFIPDTLGNNLFAAAVGLSCVPVFSRLYAVYGAPRLVRSFRSATLAVLLASAALLVLLLAGHRSIAEIMTSGMQPEWREKTRMLLLIMLPTVLLFPTVAIGGALLQTVRNFTVPALAPLLFHAAFLTAILIAAVSSLPQGEGASLIAACITAGVAAMLLLTAWAMRKALRFAKADLSAVSREKPVETPAGRSDLRDIFAVFLPYFIILLSVQAVYFYERMLAVRMPTGTAAGLNYAFRLSQFPIWVFVAAVSAVLVPAVAGLLAKGQKEQTGRRIAGTLKNVLILSVPMAAFLYILRVPVLTCLFLRGSFDANSLSLTSDILSGYSLAIVGQAVSLICLRSLLACGYIGFPLAASLVSAAVNIAADTWLAERYGAPGLGYGAAGGAACQTVLLVAYLAAKLDLPWRSYPGKLLKIAAAGVVLLFPLLAASILWDRLPLHGRPLLQFLYLAIAGIASVLIYGTALAALKVSMKPMEKAGVANG